MGSAKSDGRYWTHGAAALAPVHHPGSTLAVALRTLGATRGAAAWQLAAAGAGELPEVTGAWLDKTDNPGMAEWSLRADDVYGAVVLVRFAERQYKMGITADYTTRPAPCTPCQMMAPWWSAR